VRRRLSACVQTAGSPVPVVATAIVLCGIAAAGHGAAPLAVDTRPDVPASAVRLGGPLGMESDPIPINITQSLDPYLIDAYFSCADGATGPTYVTSFMRRFDPWDEYQIDEPYDVVMVELGFGYLEGPSGSGVQHPEIYLWAVEASDPLSWGNLMLLDSEVVTVYDSDAMSFLTVQIDATIWEPEATHLVVEIISEDLSAGGAFFYGANTQGQIAPSFVASGPCGYLDPVTMASIGYPDYMWTIHPWIVRLLIFEDGFESGDTSHWSSVVP